MNIAELRRLEAEATPGPWSVDRHFVVGPRLDTDDQSHGMINGVADIYGPNRSKDAALIVAMRNALPEMLDRKEEDGWQPIETAPVWKDENDLILLYEPHSEGGFIFVGGNNPMTGNWFNNLDGETQSPTHWRPLPLPPHGGPDVS